MSKRETIINSAYYVFTKKGYEAATIARIASHSSISKGSVYTYFRSKEALLYEIIKKISVNMSKTLEEIELTKNLQTDTFKIANVLFNYLNQYQSEFRLLANKDALQKLALEDNFVSPFEPLDIAIYSKLNGTGISIEFAKSIRSVVIDIAGDFFISNLEKTDKDFQTIIWNILVGQQQQITITKNRINWVKVYKWSTILFIVIIVSGIIELALYVMLFLSGKV
jgi:AcrR family transcriptional regulator